MQNRIFVLTCFFLVGFVLTFYIAFNQNSLVLNKAKQIKVLGEKTAILPTATATPSPIPTNTPTPLPIPTNTPVPIPTPTFIPVPLNLDELFTKYSTAYSVAKDLLQKIANCESGLNTQAINGDYGGIFQFSSQTWITNRNNMGLDGNTALRLNADESIKTAAFMISENKTSAWLNCSR